MYDECSCESIVCSPENGTCNVVKDRFLYSNVSFTPRNIVAQLCEPSCAFTTARRPVCHDATLTAARMPVYDSSTTDGSAFLDSVLLQGVRLYVQKGNTRLIPSTVPFALPNAIDCLAYAELTRRTTVQSILWLYNLVPHRTYAYSFGAYRHQKVADADGRLFLFDQHPFPIRQYALQLHADEHGGGQARRNTFLSTHPTAIAQAVHTRQIDTPTLLHRQLELHAPSHRIMCAVSHEPYDLPHHFVIREANGEWFLL